MQADQEVRHRVAAAKRNPEGACPHLCDCCEVVRPEIVDRRERDEPLPRGGGWRDAGEHVLAPLLQREPLAFEDRFVLSQEESDVEILPFGSTLQCVRIPKQLRIVGRELLQEWVLIGNEKLRAAGISLTAGAASQLIVDTAALVAVGADDVQSAR